MSGPRTLPHDWYPGEVPANVVIDPTAYLGSSVSFAPYRSVVSVGLRMEQGSSLCDGAMLDVGPAGRITLGRYAVLSEGARLICDDAIELGDYALVAWEAVLMDSFRVPREIGERRRLLERVAAGRPWPPSASVVPKPVRIGRNAWIGFRACVLPGVTIGEGSIVAARAVVRDDVPPHCVSAGDPARIVRRLEAGSREEAR